MSEQLASPSSGVTSTLSNIASNATQSVSNLGQSLAQNVGTAQASLNQTMSSFSNSAAVGSSSEFLQSNSLVAKFAFIIFILIAFMFLFSLGSGLLGMMFSPSKTPKLVNGYRSGGSPKTVGQDPNSSNPLVIYRSSNAQSGMEFTWSTWLNITDVGIVGTGNNARAYAHIFSKGTDTFNNNGKSDVNNAPGLYLKRGSNALHFVLDVESPMGGIQKDAQTIDIENIPLKKWFHLAIRLQNHVMDVYINGTIAKRLSFDYVVKQNYNDVLVAHNGGFSGSISDLRYYDRALNSFELNSIVGYGPNLVTNDDNSGASSSYDYISGSWFSSMWQSQL
jgi:hypothetical protein